MAEQHKYTAQIKSKGLDATGVTEDHARTMAATLGSHTLLIIEVKHDQQVTNAEGQQQVKLTITSAEPVPAALEDQVRDLQRALYRQRPENVGQSALDVGAGQTAEQAAAVLDAQIERDEDGRVVGGVWNGDTDGPLAAVPDGPTFVTCDYPDCKLPAEHDGDHDTAEDDEPATV